MRPNPMSQQLSDWANRWQHVAILLKGGDKAFCAGAISANRTTAWLTPRPKCLQHANPCWGWILRKRIQPIPGKCTFTQNPYLGGNGITVMAVVWAWWRCVATVSSPKPPIFAMPEITIGLYPDATGSWFCRVCSKLGCFGLTGRTATPTMRFSLALLEYAVASSEYDKGLDALKQTNWQAGVIYMWYRKPKLQL